MSNTAIYESDLEDGDTSANNAGVDSDSDDESLINVDSPADGYFAHRAHPQETFVENPALQPSEEKSREAAGERPNSSAPGRLTPLQSVPTRAPVWNDENAPLLDAGPPPPDYAAATAHQTVPQLQSQQQTHGHVRGGSYGSMSTPPQSQAQGEPAPFSSDHPLVRNGLFGEQRVLGSRGQPPQSMRDAVTQHSVPHTSVSHSDEVVSSRPEEHRDEEARLEARQQFRPSTKQRKIWRWCCCRPMAWLNFCLVFGVILAIVLISRANMNTDGNNPSNGDDKQKLPVHKPGKRPTVPIPDHPDSPQCTFDSYSKNVSFEFYSPGNFTLLELIDSSNYAHLLPAGATLSGTLKIAPAPAEQVADILVWMSAASTKPWSVTKLRYEKDEDGLELKFPEVEERPQHDLGLQGYTRACLDIAALVQVREGVSVQNWEVSTANMDVVIENGLFPSGHKDGGDKMLERRLEEGGLVVRNETSIWAIKGVVSSAYWTSRRTRVTTISGHISGTYALHDFLELDSGSGAITVGVEPQKADKDAPAPAEFRAASKSGAINVEFPSRHGSGKALIPEREYLTRVESYNSHISGRYLLGASSTFTSYSGDLDIYVLPYSAELFNSTLHSKTYSGDTKLNLLDAITAVPFSEGAESVGLDPPYLNKWNIGSIRSIHKSTSGSLDLIYPGHWTGLIDGRSVTGGIDVRGKDVKIVKNVDAPAKRRVVATKGSGDSKLIFKTISGNVDVQVGNEY